MATYVVTLKQGLGKNGKSRTQNRTVKVVASDSKTARQIAETKGWAATLAVPEAENKKTKASPVSAKTADRDV